MLVASFNSVNITVVTLNFGVLQHSKPSKCGLASRYNIRNANSPSSSSSRSSPVLLNCLHLLWTNALLFFLSSNTSHLPNCFLQGSLWSTYGFNTLSINSPTLSHPSVITIYHNRFTFTFDRGSTSLFFPKITPDCAGLT